MFAALMFVSIQANAADFDYVDRHDNTVTTTHEAAFHITIGETFRPLGELHHRQESNGRMFQVSFAAFADGSDIILIHAERLEAENGILTYDHLPQGLIDGIPFGLQEQCIPAEAALSLADNPEAQFVTERGFDIRLPFYLTQHLIASEDGNAELILSYGRPVDNCTDIPESFTSETRTRAVNTITLEHVSD